MSTEGHTPSLFDGPQPVRRDATRESREAAQVPMSVASAKRIRVLRYIDVVNGATCDEGEVVLGMTHQSLSPVLNWLERRGFVERAGERRRTRSGRMAAVYTITPAGREALR